MRECGGCLQEALKLGAWCCTAAATRASTSCGRSPSAPSRSRNEAFYESRYIKIAQALRVVDRIAAVMAATFATTPLFRGVEPLVFDFARIARSSARPCVPTRTSSTCGRSSSPPRSARRAHPALGPAADESTRQLAADGLHLILQGRNLVTDIIRARVTMPKSARGSSALRDLRGTRASGLASPLAGPTWASGATRA